MSRPGPIRRELESLVNGFDFYSRPEGLARDDLRVRQAAGDRLTEAAATLARARVAWAGRELPAPRRDGGLPGEGLARLRRVTAVEESLRDLEVRLRSATLPAPDRAFRLLHGPEGMLQTLLEADRLLVVRAVEVAEKARHAAARDLDEASLKAVEEAARGVEAALRSRAEVVEGLL